MPENIPDPKESTELLDNLRRKTGTPCKYVYPNGGAVCGYSKDQPMHIGSSSSIRPALGRHEYQPSLPGEIGTVRTIPIDGDVFPDSTTEKPFMEIWVIMPDGYRLGVTLSMKPEEFLQTVWVGKIASAMNRLREEYEARTK